VEPGEAASQFQLEAPSFTVEPAPAVEPVADDAPAALQAKAQHPAEPEPAASEPLLPDNGGAAAAEESVAVHQFLPELQLESGAEDADNLAASPPEPPAMPMAEGVPVVEPVMELAPLTDALAADMSPMTEGESAPPQVSAPPPPAIPGPAPADPLAAVKALSAEELIALFT